MRLNVYVLNFIMAVLNLLKRSFGIFHPIRNLVLITKLDTIFLIL
jgi:hypothetical protein